MLPGPCQIRTPLCGVPDRPTICPVGTVVGAAPSAPWNARWGSDLVRRACAEHATLELPADEIHVWRGWLDLPAGVAAAMWGLLCTGERERAERFRFDRDRRRFIVGRGLLRLLTACYLEEPPESIRFGYGEYDKPYLDGPGPFFNLAHSGPVALLAFSSASEIGVDVELAGHDLSRERIAERFFSPAEVRALRGLPARAQARAFLNCWTRKEAFIKARGDGLSLPLDSFDVTLAPGQPPRLLRTAWSSEEPGRWHFEDLSDPDGQLIAAVASRSTGWRAVTRRVDELVGDEPSDKENR